MVGAAVDGYFATKNRRYINVANLAFGWFLGRNCRKVTLYNPETHGCYDGLSAERINRNQGAESSISYLLARLKLEEVRRGLWQKRI